jgi:hypothetical protein
MSLTQRIETLRKRHAQLEHLVYTEQQRPLPDLTRIYQFKRDKLQLKDQIVRLSRDTIPDTPTADTITGRQRGTA